MACEQYFEEIEGILAIFANDPRWPSPANLFAIPDDTGFSIIDVGCGGSSGASHLFGGLRYWGLDLKELHTVVITHAHPDHMGAMKAILKEVSPRVLVHHLDVASARDPVKLLESFDVELSHQCWASSDGLDSYADFDLLNYFEQQGCPMNRAEDAEGIAEGDVLTLGPCAFEVVHTPGHSPGHISLFEKSTGVLLAGDVLGSNPTWYTPTSGGVVGYLESLDKLEALESKMVLPSHGPVIDEPLRAVATIRDKLLERDSILKDQLIDGPKSFLELNKLLFPGPFARFFPGCGITESHLIKLETEEVIRRNGRSISLAKAAH